MEQIDFFASSLEVDSTHYIV
jgi:hypothetical protein